MLHRSLICLAAAIAVMHLCCHAVAGEAFPQAANTVSEQAPPNIESLQRPSEIAPSQDRDYQLSLHRGALVDETDGLLGTGSNKPTEGPASEPYPTTAEDTASEMASPNAELPQRAPEVKPDQVPEKEPSPDPNHQAEHGSSPRAMGLENSIDDPVDASETTPKNPIATPDANVMPVDSASSLQSQSDPNGSSRMPSAAADASTLAQKVADSTPSASPPSTVKAKQPESKSSYWITAVVGLIGLMLSLAAVGGLIGAVRDGVVRIFRTGRSDNDALEQFRMEYRGLKDSLQSRQGTPFVDTQLEQYYTQVRAQSNIAFWFSLVFAAAGFIVIITALFSSALPATMSLRALAGVVMNAVAGLFYVQSQRAQVMMARFFDTLRRDQKHMEARRLIDAIKDPDKQDELRIRLVVLYSTEENQATPYDAADRSATNESP